MCPIHSHTSESWISALGVRVGQGHVVSLGGLAQLGLVVVRVLVGHTGGGARVAFRYEQQLKQQREQTGGRNDNSNSSDRSSSSNNNNIKM